jgi:hypothetical protein
MVCFPLFDAIATITDCKMDVRNWQGFYVCVNLVKMPKISKNTEFLLTNINNQLIINNTGDIIKPAEPDNPLRKKIPSQFVGFSLGVDMRNVIFQKEGIYVLSVYFDNEKIGERELYVVEDMQNE